MMHIEFDNSARLFRNVYYFEYKGICYKLIQNNFRKWCDVLITILNNSNDQKSINNVYAIASEFLSALSWQNESKILMYYSGGIDVPQNVPLRKTKSTIHGIRPRISLSDYSIRYYDIGEIPEIETEEQKVALTLFREALSSNNMYLAFLFYWQILETGRNDAISWVNKAYLNKKNYNWFLVSKDEVQSLPLNNKTIGYYLYDDCRNAIAHIKRNKGKVKLVLDSANDNKRINVSLGIVKKFAKFYIADQLKLQKSLYLVRKYKNGFPSFVDKKIKNNFPCSVAYKKPSINDISIKRRVTIRK